MKKEQEKTVQKQLKAKCFSVECPDMNMGDNSNSNSNGNGNINIDTHTKANKRARKRAKNDGSCTVCVLLIITNTMIR